MINLRNAQRLSIVSCLSVILAIFPAVSVSHAAPDDTIPSACVDGVTMDPAPAPADAGLIGPVTDNTQTNAYIYEGVVCKSVVQQKGGFYRGQNTFSVTYCSNADGYSEPLSVWGQNWITSHNFITGLATGKVSVTVVPKDKPASISAKRKGLSGRFSGDWFTVAIGRLHFGNYTINVNSLGGTDDRFIQDSPLTYETHNFLPSSFSGQLSIKNCGVNKLDINFTQQYDSANPNGFDVIANVIWENSSGDTPCDNSANYQFSLYGNIVVPRIIDPCTYAIKIAKPADLLPPRPSKPYAYWINNWLTTINKTAEEAQNVIQKSTFVPVVPKPEADPLQIALQHSFNRVLSDPNGLNLAVSQYNANPKTSGTCKLVIDLATNLRSQFRGLSSSFDVAQTSYANIKSTEVLIYSNIVVRSLAMGAQLAAIVAALGLAPEAIPSFLASRITTQAGLALATFLLDFATAMAGFYQTFESAKAEGKLDAIDLSLNFVSFLSNKLSGLALLEEHAFGNTPNSTLTNLPKGLAVLGNVLSIYKGYKDLVSEVQTLKNDGTAHLTAYQTASTNYNKLLNKAYEGVSQLNQAVKGCPVVTIGLKASNASGDSASTQKSVVYGS